MDWLSSLIGGLIAILAGVATLAVEKLWNLAGNLDVFYVISSDHKSPIRTFGVSESTEGLAFVVPLVFELQNTSNSNRVMRDVSVIMYKDGEYIDEMIQIGKSGQSGDNVQNYGTDNQSYSFVVQAKSIQKIYVSFVYTAGNSLSKEQDFNELRLRYYNEKNKPCEYHLRYIEDPWNQYDLPSDDNWILLKNNTCYKNKNVDSEPIVDNISLSEEKIAYLQLIQEPIGRMSTTSAIFKGFSATIVSGVAALAYSDVSSWILGLSFIPTIIFAIFDTYYLKLEKKYRYLYESVRTNKHEIDFSMKLTNDNKTAKSRVFDCIKSPSIWLFYLVMIAILVMVFYLKLKEVV